VIGEFESIKYLGSFAQRVGGFVVDVKFRVVCGWMKWREALGVLCDKKILMRLKGEFYRSVVRPCGSECWAVNRRIEQSVADVRMLRWMSARVQEKME